MPINLSIEYPKMEAENQKLKRLLHDLTPGGSEFYNDPEYCAKWIRENRLEEKKQLTGIIAEKKKELEASNLEIESLKEDLSKSMELAYQTNKRNEVLVECLENFIDWDNEGIGDWNTYIYKAKLALQANSIK